MVKHNEYYDTYFAYCIAKPNNDNNRYPLELYIEGKEVFQGSMHEAITKRDEIRKKSKRHDYEIYKLFKI